MLLGYLIGAVLGSWTWVRLAAWSAGSIWIGERLESTTLRFFGLLIALAALVAIAGAPTESVLQTAVLQAFFGVFWLWRYSGELSRERERLELVERAEAAEAAAQEAAKEAKRARRRRRHRREAESDDEG